MLSKSIATLSGLDAKDDTASGSVVLMASNTNKLAGYSFVREYI